MDAPTLRLFRALEHGIVLYRVRSAQLSEPAVAEVNRAARLLGVSPTNGALLEGVQRAATFGLDVTVPDVPVAGGRPIEARIHVLGDGWIGAVFSQPDSARHIDGLTGLGNRDRFIERLDLAVATAADTGQPVATYLVDLDHLQEINDTLGHAQGDLLLQQAGSRLLRLPLGLGEPCRIGSDEFGLVAPLGRTDPAATARAIADAFTIPFALGRLTVRTTASVGAAVAPAHAVGADGLLRCADVAQRAAKRGGGAAVYRRDRDPYDLRRLRLLPALRDAIEGDGLSLRYQPKLDLRTNEVVGVEALVRWHDAEFGDVEPGEFIPLAEDRGLIGPLSQWVLAESGRQCRAWGGRGVELGMSANISAQNLYDPGLVRWLDAMFESGVKPGQLTLELTETQVVEDLPMAAQVLRRLRSMGARLSIDDFGTGYSSLHYLSRLPLDELKIDRSFVVDLTDGGHGESIVQTIIGLGHELGLRVVAEGVESADAATTLTSMSCDQIQGFHVSHPLDGDDVEGWMAGRTLVGA